MKQRLIETNSFALSAADSKMIFAAQIQPVMNIHSNDALLCAALIVLTFHTNFVKGNCVYNSAFM